jgi:hypothetical protein
MGTKKYPIIVWFCVDHDLGWRKRVKCSVKELYSSVQKKWKENTPARISEKRSVLVFYSVVFIVHLPVTSFALAVT